MSVHKPSFGIIREGEHVFHVHARSIDHLKVAPDARWYNRFNSWLAIKITQGVGTMWCAYIFAALDSLALPEAIHGGLYGMVQWTASFFLQLVLLSVIMVGQNMAALSSDARAAKTFQDGEENKDNILKALDSLDLDTEGGLRTLLDGITHIQGLLAYLEPPEELKVK